MAKSKMKNAQAKLGASVDLAGGQATDEKVSSDHTSVSEVLTSKSTAREARLAKVLVPLRHGLNAGGRHSKCARYHLVQQPALHAAGA